MTQCAITRAMMKKLISIALAAAQLSQLTWICSAQAGGPTPEFKLMEASIALEGQNLSNQSLQTNLAGLIREYTATANPEGAQQRLRDAFVQLQIYTPAQAAMMSAQFAATQQRLTTQHFSSEAAANQAIAQEVGTLLTNSPEGAQFSGCTVATITTLVLGVGGSLALIVAAGDRLDALDSGGSSPGVVQTDEYLAIGGAAGLGLAIGLYEIFSHSKAC